MDIIKIENIIKIDGTIETNKSHEEWLNDFIDWLESRGEYFGGGTYEDTDN